MTMVQDAVSITASLKAMRHRLFDLEISQHSRKKWHTHAALLADSATLIEMEANSLDKADRSQIHSLIRKASELDSKLKKKIDMAQLQQEMEHVATARRRALKSLQKQMNLLKNRFDGAVEDLVLQLGCNVKKELNNRPTKKEMAEMKKRMLDAFKEAERVAELERLLSSTRHDADRNQVGAAAEEMLLICAEMPMFHRSLRSSNPYSPYDRLIIIVLAHACVLYVILYEQGCAAQRCGGTAADKTSRRQTDCDIGLPLPPLLNRPPSEPSSSRTCEPSIHFCSLPFPLHVPL